MRLLNGLLIRIVLLALALLFHLIPQTDLFVSDLFYDADSGFFLKDSLPARVNYAVFLYMPHVAIPLMVWLFAASWYWGGRAESRVRRGILFLLVVLLVGPGAIVNEVLKTSIGRARPAQVEEFGGTQHFTPAFAPSNQCAKNCSFVSGHAAMGFFFLALAWPLRDRRWLVYGGIIGGVVGLGRIVQGAHFLSDIVFAYVTVLLTAMVCARLILGRWEIDPD